MAKAGRKAKPTALKLVQGNPGKRPLNKDEPQPTRVYAPQPLDSLNELDLDALEIYCRNWVAMHEAITDLNERGKLLRTATGAPMWNPSWSQYKHSEQVCRSIMSEFGMTPSSRTSVVAVGDADGKNEWEEF